MYTNRPLEPVLPSPAVMFTHPPCKHMQAGRVGDERRHSRQRTEQHSRVCLDLLCVLYQHSGKPCTTTTCKVATYVWISSRMLFTHTSTPLKTEVIQLLALWAAQYVR